MRNPSVIDGMTADVAAELKRLGYRIGSEDRFTIERDPRAEKGAPAPEYTLVGVDETSKGERDPVIWLRLRPVGGSEADGAFSVHIARATKIREVVAA